MKKVDVLYGAFLMVASTVWFYALWRELHGEVIDPTMVRMALLVTGSVVFSAGAKYVVDA